MFANGYQTGNPCKCSGEQNYGYEQALMWHRAARCSEVFVWPTLCLQPRMQLQFLLFFWFQILNPIQDVIELQSTWPAACCIILNEMPESDVKANSSVSVLMLLLTLQWNRLFLSLSE